MRPEIQNAMLYDAYEVQRSWLAGASAMAQLSASWLNNPANPLSYSGVSPVVASALDVFAHAAAPRGKPDFGFETTLIDDEPVGEMVFKAGFNSLISWSGLDIDRDRASPVSHYAAPFAFSGRLFKVTVRLEAQQELDGAAIGNAEMARQ